MTLAFSPTMDRRLWVLVLFLLLELRCAQPVRAIWYEDYQRAVESLERGGCSREAIDQLRAAIRERAEPSDHARTMSVRTIEYYPYMYLARGYLSCDEAEEAREALRDSRRHGEAPAEELSALEEQIARRDVLPSEVERARSAIRAAEQAARSLEALGAEEWSQAFEMDRREAGAELEDARRMLTAGRENTEVDTVRQARTLATQAAQDLSGIEAAVRDLRSAADSAEQAISSAEQARRSIEALGEGNWREALAEEREEAEQSLDEARKALSAGRSSADLGRMRRARTQAEEAIELLERIEQRARTLIAEEAERTETLMQAEEVEERRRGEEERRREVAQPSGRSEESKSSSTPDRGRVGGGETPGMRSSRGEPESRELQDGQSAQVAQEPPEGRFELEVREGRIVLSAGARQGVRIGLEGRICSTYEVKGREHEACRATFRVVTVAAGWAEIEIVKKTTEAEAIDSDSFARF